MCNAPAQVSKLSGRTAPQAAGAESAAGSTLQWYATPFNAVAGHASVHGVRAANLHRPVCPVTLGSRNVPGSSV
eukprot:5441372-Prymnesium_polylepis.1